MNEGLPLLSGQVIVKIVNKGTSHAERVPHVGSCPAVPSDLGLFVSRLSWQEARFLSFFLEIWKSLQSTLDRLPSTPLTWHLSQ